MRTLLLLLGAGFGGTLGGLLLRHDEDGRVWFQSKSVVAR